MRSPFFAVSTSPTPFLLIVDDSDEDLFLLKRLVHRSGISLPCQSATGVASATVLLEAALRPDSNLSRPKACFVDIKMPGQNGFDLLRWIRSRGGLSTMPVIMLSSSDDPRDLQLAAELGAHCFLTKYPSTKTLVEVINDADLFPEQPDVFKKPYNLLRQVPLFEATR